MTTLVTGGTGLLGNNIVRRLAAAGEPVRVLARPRPHQPALAGLAVEICAGEVTSAEDVQRAMTGVRAVIHAAGNVHIGWRGAAAQQQTNVLGTETIVRAALSQKVRVIHISSVNALGLGSRRQPAQEHTALPQPVRCPYVTSKQAADEVVWRGVGQGLEAVVLYPSFMLGPWDWKPSSGRMFLGVARSRPLLAPRGGCSVTDARDVAAAVVSARDLGRTGARYVLAGHNLSYLELWRRMAEVSGTPPPWGRLGPLLGSLVGWVGDAAAGLGAEPDWNSAAIRMGGQWHYFDSESARRDLAYRVRPLEEILRDAWRWLDRRNPDIRRQAARLPALPRGAEHIWQRQRPIRN